MKCLVLFLHLSLSASFEQFAKQVSESVRERQVTVKIIEDRVHAIERREKKIRELVTVPAHIPDDTVDELQQLCSDRHRLEYVLKYLKANI